MKTIERQQAPKHAKPSPTKRKRFGVLYYMLPFMMLLLLGSAAFVVWHWHLWRPSSSVEYISIPNPNTTNKGPVRCGNDQIGWKPLLTITSKELKANPNKSVQVSTNDLLQTCATWDVLQKPVVFTASLAYANQTAGVPNIYLLVDSQPASSAIVASGHYNLQVNTIGVSTWRLTIWSNH